VPRALEVPVLLVAAPEAGLSLSAASESPESAPRDGRAEALPAPSLPGRTPLIDFLPAVSLDVFASSDGLPVAPANLDLVANDVLVVAAPPSAGCTPLALAILVVAPPLSAVAFAFSSILALTAFCFSSSFYFRSSVALRPAAAAVGLASLDGAFRPPPALPAVPGFSSLAGVAEAAPCALFSASLAACLSINVILGLAGEEATPDLSADADG